MLLAARVALRTGITSVQTLLDTPDQMAAYARLRRKGRLPIRVTGMPPYASAAALHAHGDQHARSATSGSASARSKLFSDGSLGAQTALARRAVRRQARHARHPHLRPRRPEGEGAPTRRRRDSSSRSTRSATRRCARRSTRSSSRWPRPERATTRSTATASSTPRSRRRTASSGWRGTRSSRRSSRSSSRATRGRAERVGPHRVPWAYPFKSLLAAGVPVTLSSDCPVERLDAFAALASAVGRHAWCGTAEALTPEEAIRAYCLGSAYAAHAEHFSGSLDAGQARGLRRALRRPDEARRGKPGRAEGGTGVRERRARGRGRTRVVDRRAHEK